MLTSSPPSCETRKHSKTFTGCWTCRSRKVKCDEGKPACRQCCTKGLGCEGYGVRLYWMPPDHGKGGRHVPRTSTQRSQIAFDSRQHLLHGSEVDTILDSIDSYEFESSSRERPDPFFIHNFGVFDTGGHLPSPEDPRCDVEPRGNTNASSSCLSDAELLYPNLNHTTHDDSPDFSYGYAGNDSSTNGQSADASGAFHSAQDAMYLGNASDLTPNDLASASISMSESAAAFFDMTCSLPQETRDSNSQQDNNYGVFPQHCRWQTPAGAIIRNPSSSSLPELEQFLMYHYTHRAVNLFCVIDNQKSPWKTIHLPRAMQSIGQLSVAGSSSTIRNALRNALLSISAFYLSNDSKSRLCIDEAERWKHEATMLRGKAIQLLKDAVNNDFNNKKMPKYKEFLATMLSMITINVMSGDLGTCGLHLDGAYRFISQASTWKTKFSHKARSLHRIYFYLRTIYESTAVTRPEKRHRLSPPSRFTASRPMHPSSTEDVDRPEDIHTSHPLPDLPEPGAQMTTYECIYGVPQNLLILLCRTTELIREVSAHREKQKDFAMPQSLTSRCDALESSIMDWPIHQELQRFEIEDMSASSAEIIRLTTSAFHDALIIYFAQHIRLLSHRYLKGYVEEVLRSLEDIEKIKAESRILAAPMYWPAFIAASEAFHEELQARFRDWYNQVEMYGIEAVRTGISVVTEVWRRGPTTSRELTSRWRTVVNETGASLMLS